VFLSLTNTGGAKSYSNFADATASHPVCVMQLRREKYCFPCEENDIVCSSGGGGRGGGKR
jgi:hypothetical protein